MMVPFEWVLAVAGVVAFGVGLAAVSWSVQFSLRLRAQVDRICADNEAKIAMVRSEAERRSAHLEGQIEILQQTIAALSKSLDPNITVNLKRVPNDHPGSA